MLDLLGRDPALEQALIALVHAGTPTLATCAGLILIARRVHDPEQRSLGLLDVEVRRNARGRQIHSSEVRDDSGQRSLVLIRAPRISSVGEGVEVLATLEGEPVLVRQDAIIGATFHPELTTDRSVHALFIESQRKRASISEGPRGSSSIASPSIADTSVSGVASAIR